VTPVAIGVNAGAPGQGGPHGAPQNGGSNGQHNGHGHMMGGVPGSEPPLQHNSPARPVKGEIIAL
jgi:hypothetical protein